MFDGLYVLSPVSGVDCHRCQARTGGPDRRHGRGARTTRFRRTLQRFRLEPKLLTPQASIATRATFRDDREASLMAARAERTSATDLPDGAREIFFAPGMDGVLPDGQINPFAGVVTVQSFREKYSA